MPKTATPTSPFTGIKLSEQTSVASTGPDQRLFQPTSLPPRPPEDIKEPEKGEGGKEGKREVERKGNREGDLPRGREDETGPVIFDINERPYRKGSFMLTNEEFWALDEIKLDLQKHHDIVATKDDLARCAFRYLLDEYKMHPESSFIVRVLREKARK